MAYHDLTENFRGFFRRLNPSPTFESQASSEYSSIKSLIEDRSGLARELAPTGFLQGPYKKDTPICTINAIDVVALCQRWHPAAGAGSGRTCGRDEIFRTIAAPLLNDRRYASKVRYDGGSMCIKVDLDIKVEILPVVFKAENNDPSIEPFRLYRPEARQWEDGYARWHQRWLTWKNSADKTTGNFIPSIKVLKHLRSHYRLDAVSFHLECLLFALEDENFPGGAADWIANMLSRIARVPAATWYQWRLETPCKDGRDIFSGAEWKSDNWVAFHERVVVWARLAQAAVTENRRERAIALWQTLLGDDFFPAYV